MYEAAPIAFKVTVLPKQIAVDVELAINVGVGVTENEIVVVETQPKPFTPVTENVEVIVGVIIIEEETAAPGFHV